MKLGKKPARPGAIQLAFAKYAKAKKLPMPADPDNFGHEALETAPWGMLGNADYGDCVWAGAAHETMLANVMGGRVVSFTDQCVLSDYSAVTGFDPSRPDADQGTDMQVAASYRRKTGVVDANGVRHQVIAYLALDPKKPQQIVQALYLFGFVGLGLRFPTSAMRQFDEGKAWDVVRGARIYGGHYVPLMAVREGNPVCVTWGKLQAMTPAFLRKYADEAVAYVTAESLTNGRSLEGFDLNTLVADLKQVTKAL